MLLGPRFFLDPQWFRCLKVTVLYLYLVVGGVMDWSFAVWGSNCKISIDLCRFLCFSAQLSPPPLTYINFVKKGWSFAKLTLRNLTIHKYLFSFNLFQKIFEYNVIFSFAPIHKGLKLIHKQVERIFSVASFWFW